MLTPDIVKKSGGGGEAGNSAIVQGGEAACGKNLQHYADRYLQQGEKLFIVVHSFWLGWGRKVSGHVVGGDSEWELLASWPLRALDP